MLPGPFGCGGAPWSPKGGGHRMGDFPQARERGGSSHCANMPPAHLLPNPVVLLLRCLEFVSTPRQSHEKREAIGGEQSVRKRGEGSLLSLRKRGHRCASRFPTPFGRGKRGASSKSARFISRRERFADFHRIVCCRSRCRCGSAPSELVSTPARPKREGHRQGVLLFLVEQGRLRMNTPPKLRFRLQMPFLYHPAGHRQCSTASCWR